MGDQDPGTVADHRGRLRLAEELAAADARFREEMDRLRSRQETYVSDRVREVRELAKTATAARADLDAAVAAARSAGATWDAIAEAVGIARQSAWRRWNKPRAHQHEAASDGGPCPVCGAPA